MSELNPSSNRSQHKSPKNSELAYLYIVLTLLLSISLAVGFNLVLSQSVLASDKTPSSVPEFAPSLSLKDLDGKEHDLAKWQGKTRLINFWASYCYPCKKEIKELIKYQETYEKDGLQVIGIGVNDEQSIKTMSLLLGANYPMLLANIDKPENENILSQWGNTKSIIPYTVLVNPEGKIIYRHHGIIKEKVFKDKILPLIKNG